MRDEIEGRQREIETDCVERNHDPQRPCARGTVDGALGGGCTRLHLDSGTANLRIDSVENFERCQRFIQHGVDLIGVEPEGLQHAPGLK